MQRGKEEERRVHSNSNTGLSAKSKAENVILVLLIIGSLNRSLLPLLSNVLHPHS